MIQYYEKWFRAKRKPTKPLSEKEAKIRHTNGLAYIALLTFENKKFVIDIVKGWVEVFVLDNKEREYIRYTFKDKNDTKIFMISAVYIEYSNINGEPISSVIFSFNENEEILIEKTDYKSGNTDQRITKANSEANWDFFPNFGNYESVCRIDRIVSLIKS